MSDRLREVTQPRTHQCRRSKYATGGLGGVRSTSPPLQLLFFIKGEGKETLTLVCGPFGRSNPELPSRAMPSGAGTEGAGRHPPSSPAGAADQLLLTEPSRRKVRPCSQAAELTANMLILQLHRF